MNLRLDILTCTRCPLSSKVRAPVPFDHSPGPAPLYLVVGEAPGRMEDYTGKPFYGPAGTLLKRNLDRIGLGSEHGAYLNAVSCWPGPSGLKAPEKEHMNACAHHLKAQLELFGFTPHVLLTGLTALRAILPSADLLHTMCNPFTLHDKTFYTVWHPAYIQRNMNLVKVWRQHLRTFADIVYQRVDTPTNHCIYCNATRERGLNTCRKHNTRFVKDSKWPVYKAQQRLFDLG